MGTIVHALGIVHSVNKIEKLNPEKYSEHLYFSIALSKEPAEFIKNQSQCAHQMSSLAEFWNKSVNLAVHFAVSQDIKKYYSYN